MFVKKMSDSQKSVFIASRFRVTSDWLEGQIQDMKNDIMSQIDKYMYCPEDAMMLAKMAEQLASLMQWRDEVKAEEEQWR